MITILALLINSASAQTDCSNVNPSDTQARQYCQAAEKEAERAAFGFLVSAFEAVAAAGLEAQCVATTREDLALCQKAREMANQSQQSLSQAQIFQKSAKENIQKSNELLRK